ncbi:hypothetical protein COBT_002631 [Conglomerata obtusa]
MFKCGDKVIKESLELSQLASKEIDEIKTEIDLQNEKLVNIQKKNGETIYLFSQNEDLINDIFKNTKFGMSVIVLFLLIVFLLGVFIKISYF